MIIMMAANMMNPTAQPLVAFPARPADLVLRWRLLGHLPNLLVLVGWPPQQQIGRPGSVLGATVPLAPGSGITRKG
jgi:hypothetical protein